jgi:hypothetical protein
MLYTVHLAWVGFNITTLMVIGTDYIGSCDHDHDGPSRLYNPEIQATLSTKDTERK